MNYSGFMGGLFALTEWFMRFSVINILWIITNLPVLLIVILMVLSQTTSSMIMLAIPLAVLLPLLFFPSTTSVFANARDWILNKEQPSLLKSFWLYLKENYRKSFSFGLILTIAWIVWLIDYYYFGHLSNILIVVMFLIGLALFVYTINVINLNVHYVMSIKALFKNAFFLTIGKPLLFIFILTSNLFLLYISLTKVWFLIPFFAISISGFLSFFAFYWTTLRVQKKSN